MSTINKLQIQGIRSFSPDDPQVIAFRKPLTLIVGSNGSGKTTIIECIKMALTGELPPDANRGKNFIHDPKVQANTETKAAIKMQFQTVNGKKCTVARQFTLQYKTRKEDAVPSYSMSSSSLNTVNERGEKVIISQRCVDIDKAVPQHMGISKAILENVIFVHQEEANWPLKESKVLKQKFDDIFSATRYSKALDAIKKLRKEKMDEVKDQKIQLAEKKARVEAKQDILKRKRQQENQIAELQQHLVECEEDFAENKRKYEELLEVRSELERLDSQIKGFKATRDEMVRNKEQLRETIDQNGEEYLEEDSDDDLRKWRDQLLRSSDSANGKMLATENDIEQKRVEIDEKENFLQKSTRDKVLLEREVEEHKINIKARETRAHEIAEQMRLAQGSDVDETHENINQAVREHEGALRELKEKHRHDLDLQRRKLSDARNDLSQSEEKLKNLRVTEQRDREQLQQLTKGLQRGDYMTGDQLERDKLALKDAEESQKKYRQETEQLKNEIRRKAKDEASIKAKKEDLDEELSNMVSQQDAITKLHTLRDQTNSKQAQVDEAFDKIEAEVHGHSDGRRIGSSADDVEQFIQQYVKDSENAARDAKHSYMRLTSSKNQTEERIRELEVREAEQNDTIASLEKKIKKAKKTMDCEHSNESWNDIVARREQDLKKAELGAERLRASAPIYEEFLEKALGMRGPCHGCPVCERPFNRIEDFREFEDRIKAIVNSGLTDDLSDKDQQLAADRKKLEFCKGKQHIWDDLQRMKGVELPKIRDEIEAKQQECSDLRGSEAGAKKRSDDAGLAEVHAKQLEGTWQRHQRDRAELIKLKRELGSAESNVLGVNAARGMEAVHNDAERLKRELDEVTSQVRSLYEKQNKNDTHINQLGVQIVEKQKKISEALRLAEVRKQDEKQRRILEEKLPGMKQQITELSETIADAKLVLPTMDAEEQELIRQQRQTEASSETRLDGMRSSLADLSRMRNAIEQFVREDRQGQLNKLCVEVEQKQNDKTRLKGEIGKLEQDLAGLRKSNADQSGMLRNMQDVINFRAKQADIEEINRKIHEMNDDKAKIAQDPDWERQLSKLGKIVQNGLTEQGEYQGSKNQCEDELRKLSEQLKGYHKADEEYRTTLITVKTLELGSADLEKYHGALDKALVTYHAEKMQEVNEIAKFLWGQTYKGQDIESIEIRADEAGKKSYNYRLLMRKGNAELDMRGRCSAGQKVLAALVIRLALAETFCLNCGILALDEPTTNLDVENIKSLCNALKEIITQRKRQKNFQLVIITHDEDFMSELARVDGICDTYYRVSKNEQTQTSMIAEQDLNAAY